MTSALLGLQIVLAVLIVVVVLLQKSSSIGLGAYSGSNESLFGAKGPASFMAKLTMFLGLLFVANTIALGYFYNKEYGKSILDETKTNKELSPLVPATGTLNPTLNPLEQAPTNPLMPKQTPNELPKEPAKAPFIESPKQNEKNDAKKENKENNIKGVEKTKEDTKTPPTAHQKPKTHTQTNTHTNQKKDEK
ncbi:preprotein translocase subunit SecG [Helicobacter pylori UM299]|uniref:preprotein translocase subunit SecG n=1 Tax=Helicobacter pylori TaxID=210 RepID=UPI0003296E54|nr:preprotein translocase subunit SecG [Helicobacter pylori]AGL66745.1 preprotein translocase subunit SecG [Helicobacter pylori UM032]AGL68849.1 preprotein translocase subunit SecG [Helicobacter pylori UM299]AGR62860.1 preprotein translocase subunit SecG [Helicobacter pylori UM298]